MMPKTARDKAEAVAAEAEKAAASQAELGAERSPTMRIRLFADRGDGGSGQANILAVVSPASWTASWRS